MRAFFIYRDGEPFGSKLGYTTEAGARKALVGCEDWYRLQSDFNRQTSHLLPQELLDTGCFEWLECTQSCMFNREAWSRRYWAPYVREHYEIREREFDIVFLD